MILHTKPTTAVPLPALSVSAIGAQFALQQPVLPLLAHAEFGLIGYTFLFAHVAAVGIAKTPANWFAGTLPGRHGPKPLLLAG